MCGLPFSLETFSLPSPIQYFLGAHAQELPDKLHTDGERDEVERAEGQPGAGPRQAHGVLASDEAADAEPDAAHERADQRDDADHGGRGRCRR